MSNLATMIMEGSMNGYSRANLTHTYGHEDGAGLIAMESAEALRDIFEAEFYVPNECTIQAMCEGYSSVEESSQAAIMEASIKGAVAKIKEFFIKLKDKVKEFLHNIKRYLLGIFGNDEKWVTTYEKELLGLKSNLKGYKIKMYTYTPDTAVSSVERGIKGEEDIIDDTRKKVTNIFNRLRESDSETDDGDIQEYYDNQYEDLLKGLGADDEAGLDKALWSMYRNGADGEGDKEEVEVASKMSDFIASIKRAKSDLAKIDSAATKEDTKYKKAIKLIDDTEKRLNNDKNFQDISTDGGGTERRMKYSALTGNKKDDDINTGTPNQKVTTAGISSVTAVLRKFSSYMSKCQTVNNKNYTAYKSAVVERNKAYKKALTGAFAYARKNKKENK